jgi:hypothetical protein
MSNDRRSRRREFSMTHSRRRYPRLFLDVDWFVESNGCSTLGRGLEISPRGALLPVTCKGSFSSSVTLFVALPRRARMFRAKGVAVARAGKGYAIVFREVGNDDLTFLANTLIDEHGLAAVPALERKYAKYMEFEPRHLRDSISVTASE